MQTFSQIVASISPVVLEKITGDKSVFLNTHLTSEGVLVYGDLDNNDVNISGSLDQILKCAMIFRKTLLYTEEVEETSFYDDNVCVFCNKKRSCITSDTSVDCKLLKGRQIHFENNDAHKKDVKPKIKKVESHYLNKDFTVGVRLPRNSKSKYGRSIKVPYKYNETGSDEDMSAKDSDKKDCQTEQPLSEIEDHSKGNVFLIKSETESISAIVKPRVKTKLNPPKGDKRSIKKYYEDKMPFKFFCKKCSFKSKRHASFLKHEEFHKRHPNQELYMCDKCDFTTVRSSTLSRHKMTHDAEQLKCDQCSYTTYTLQRLYEHNKMKHGFEDKSVMQPLQCTQCNYSTLSKLKLMAHAKNHSVVAKTIGSCAFCAIFLNNS